MATGAYLSARAGMQLAFAGTQKASCVGGGRVQQMIGCPRWSWFGSTAAVLMPSTTAGASAFASPPSFGGARVQVTEPCIAAPSVATLHAAPRQFYTLMAATVEQREGTRTWCACALGKMPRIAPCCALSRGALADSTVATRCTRTRRGKLARSRALSIGCRPLCRQLCQAAVGATYGAVRLTRGKHVDWRYSPQSLLEQMEQVNRRRFLLIVSIFSIGCIRACDKSRNHRWQASDACGGYGALPIGERASCCVHTTLEMLGSGIHIAHRMWHQRLSSSEGLSAPPFTGHKLRSSQVRVQSSSRRQE
jgi:hypothetical protein